jgi:DNA polymerase elongation subunit (family B)
VKGALLYNNLLEKNNLGNKYQRIFEGDKIKFAYLKLPNPVHDTVISVPGVLPKQLNLENYIDYNMQFEKSFIDPLDNILKAINWTTEQTITVEDFFK